MNYPDYLDMQENAWEQKDWPQYDWKPAQATFNTSCCDRCGRQAANFILNLGMRICGVCDYEIKNMRQ